MDNTQIATLTLAVTALIALANLITAVAAARNARIFTDTDRSVARRRPRPARGRTLGAKAPMRTVTTA